MPIRTLGATDTDTSGRKERRKPLNAGRRSEAYLRPSAWSYSGASYQMVVIWAVIAIAVAAIKWMALPGGTISEPS